MSRTDRAALTLGRRLGQGGQGTVHEVPGRRINGQWDVAYKEYDPGVLPHLDVAALTAMAGLIGRLPGWDAAWLCDKTAWPAEVVESEGEVTGFLMRSVPHRFSFDLRTLSGSVRRPATMEFLLNDDAYVGGVGLRVSDRDRLLVLADVADTLARLHTMDIVVGDLSPKNLLFATEGSPECFLIDCDAMRLAGAEALPQVETPDWQLPADEPKGTPYGDAYKFALLAVRVFARDQTSADPGRLAAVSPALAALAAAGLHGPPDQRPLPGRWAGELRQAAGSASTAPTLVPPPVPGPPPPGPPGPGMAPRPAAGLSTGMKFGLGAGAGVIGVVLVVLGAVALVSAVKRLDGESRLSAESSGTPSDVSTPWPSVSSATPEPSQEPSQTPTFEPPTEEPFDPGDLDRQDSDPTPITPGALLPHSFTSAKGVRYTLRSSGVDKCPDAYHASNVRAVLRKAHCGKMVKGSYVNPNAPANKRIMVSVWVVPLKNDGRADTAYARLDDAYADAWGIVCPRKGPGSGLCHSTSWSRAQTWGWVGYTHRYLLHTMAVYTNRANATSTRPWLKDASKAAFKAIGPMVYHDTN
ncbi:hypothetical protein [Nonomuraea sp. WAC 01424]|uniref:hypothetical protein n=1 Tax=Nonomuraea sp. WAC 01424 TaxID=2203200 RepID=UPI000F7972FE|nr:hypothetical protein [Nonomuraea sp. WAC 01424]